VTEIEPGRKYINTIRVRYIGTFNGEKVNSVSLITQEVCLPDPLDPSIKPKAPSELHLGRGGKGLDIVGKT